MKSEKKSSWLKRIVDYEDLKVLAEDYKLDKERVEDNVIRKINEMDVKIDAMLNAINCILHSLEQGNDPNSHENTKLDKSIEKGTKVENKGKRRGRPRKVEKGE